MITSTTSPIQPLQRVPQSPWGCQIEVQEGPGQKISTPFWDLEGNQIVPLEFFGLAQKNFGSQICAYCVGPVLRQSLPTSMKISIKCPTPPPPPTGACMGTQALWGVLAQNPPNSKVPIKKRQIAPHLLREKNTFLSKFYCLWQGTSKRG